MTAPISNGPTTTRLHHYAGHYCRIPGGAEACEPACAARGRPRAREKTRPAHPLQLHFREKLRPARHKTPILGHFSCAGRTFSRAGHRHVAMMQPMTPLQPLMQASVKPPSPMLAPEQQPLKPTTPMQPKNAPKTPSSRLQRRWRFQSRLGRRPQRRCRFQTSGPSGLQGLAAVTVGGGGSRASPKVACNSIG